MNQKTKGALLLILSAFLYSTMPILIRTIVTEGVPAVSQLFLRYIFAFICACVYFFLISKTKFVFPRKNFVLVIIISLFGYALGTLFFTLAIINTQVSNTLFLFYSFAIITPLLGVLFLKETINKFNIIALIIGSLALILLFQPNSFSTYKIGAIFALLATLGQSAYIIGIKKIEGYSTKFIMLINTFIGVVSVGIISLILDTSFYDKSHFLHLSFTVWIFIILLGVDNFLAWLTMTKGFEYFKATTGSIILLAEVVFGVFFAFIFFKEIPTIATFIGGILILLSSVLVLTKGKN